MDKFKNEMGKHLRVLGKGFVRTLWGSALGLTVAAAVWIYAQIHQVSGWAAVGEFLLATATLAVAVSGVYHMGGKRGA